MIPAYMLIGALVVFGVPAAIIYLLISNASLRRRVAILEQAFARPENATPAIPVQRAGPPPLIDISETEDQRNGCILLIKGSTVQKDICYPISSVRADFCLWNR